MAPKRKKRKSNPLAIARSDRLSDLSDFSTDSDGRLFNYSTDSDVEMLPSEQEPVRSPSPVA